MVYYDNIPEELKKLDQWVCANDGSKVPMKAWENEAASSTNPETWSDFETAIKVSTVKAPHTYMKAVGTRELEKILEEELGNEDTK